MKKNGTIRLDLLKLTNLLLMLIPFAICWNLYYNPTVRSWFAPRASAFLFVLYMLLYLTYVRIYDGFEIEINRISELVYSQSLAAFVTNFIMYFVIWLLAKGVNAPRVLPLFVAFTGQVIISMCWSYLIHHWYARTCPPQKTLIVYDARESVEKTIVEHRMEKTFEVIGSVEVNEFLQKPELLDNAETIFLCGVHSHDRNAIIKKCVMNKKEAYVIPRIGDAIMDGAKQAHILHLPMMQVTRHKEQLEYDVIKRVFDVVISICSLVIFSPILLITAIAIKAYDRGPVFYKQCRLTKDGKAFDIIKFRSMRVDAEKDGIARLSTGKKDDRITPVGRFIRKVRIDEIPQLINIIKGDMSIVGPRPERPEIFKDYEKELPEFALRLQVKAGLTGYAQVYGKYNTTPYDKLLLDLMYIANAGVPLDLKIIFATIKILFLPESTEGIKEGRINAVDKEGISNERRNFN